MAQQTINIGAAPDDGTGDTLRDGGDKINDNFTELYTDKLNKSGGTMTGDLVVPDEAYDATAWNGSLEVPTKNAVRDKIESLGASGLEVEDEGVSEATGVTILNFTGSGVSAADAGGGQIDITVPGGISTFAIGDATDVDTTGHATGSLLRYNGTNYVPVTLYEAGPPTPPTAADLATWDNQGTSTVTDGTGEMILKPQVDDRFTGRFKAAPATPYDIYCRLNLQYISTAAVTTGPYIQAGIMFKDTGGDNERLAFGIGVERIAGDEQHLWSLVLQRWSGASPPVLSSQVFQKFAAQKWQWLRVNNDGTTLTMYVSMDGRNWHSAGTETLAAFIDAAASFGVYARSGSNATEAMALFSYFSTTAPA